MIDIYHSRRDCNLRCVWFRAKGGHTSVQRLEYESAPAGCFYARYESGRYAVATQASNVFQHEVNTITIRTPDDADPAPNDKIEIDGDPWIVVNAQKIYERKNQFHRHSDSTVIYLRKGMQ